MKPQKAPYGLHWFRRDLRTFGNTAFEQLVDEHGGRVVGIFCFDKAFLARPDFSAIRFQFFLKSLTALKEELERRGSDLLFCDVGPDEAFASLFTQLKKSGQPLPATISWNRDYEPYAINRDLRMQGFFREQGIYTVTERDHILIEPHEVVKSTKASGPYQIYTPYSRKWLEVFQGGDVQERVAKQVRGLKMMEKFRKGKLDKDFNLNWAQILGTDGWDVFRDYFDKNQRRVVVPIPDAGPFAALERLKYFADQTSAYTKSRDFPAVDGTSRFSLFLKNGSLSTAQVIASLGLTAHEKTGRETFLKQLIWREFSYYILARYPQVEERAFDSRFARIAWEDNPGFLQAWKDGMTGFPIVDAGMRQLNETGWMHNRVRMIVASFLTKDLLVNWQHGERYFMGKLLDGDLALNNLGWQWAASTGCDAQPYFRIFNPLLQSKKFDPNGDYIRRYIPELRHLKGKAIHAPNQADRRSYPAPIVDHGQQRIEALARYRAAIART